MLQFSVHSSSESIVVAEAKKRNLSPSDNALLKRLSIKRAVFLKFAIDCIRQEFFMPNGGSFSNVWTYT